MDSSISKYRRLLLLGIVTSLGAFLLSLPHQPDPTIEGTFARDSREELIKASPEPFAGIYRETTEVYVDVVGLYKVGYEEPRPSPRHRILDTGQSIGSESTPSPYSVRTHPASIAETAYVMFWKDLIGDMDLPDERAVRTIITEWHQFNLELIFAEQEGDLTIFELVQGILSVEDLQARLAPYLTASQLIDVVENFKAFSEYVAGENA